MPTKRSKIARTSAVALTGVAGFVDAMGYLALLRVYTANMSGNSIAVGMEAVRGQWRETARRFLPIAAFFLGLTLAGIVVEAGRRWGLSRRVSLALSIELVCLISFVFLARPLARQSATFGDSEPRAASLVALAAVAMGAQNASLRETGALNTYTTHVTGTLTRLSYAAVQSVARAISPRPSRARASSLSFLTALWVVYIAGAAIAAICWQRVGPITMLIPAAFVLAVIVIDLAHPLGRLPGSAKSSAGHPSGATP